MPLPSLSFSVRMPKLGTALPLRGDKSVLPGAPQWFRGKEAACSAGDAEDIEMRVRSLGQEDPLAEGMASHSRILAWEIPWTEEPGGL